MKTPMTEGSRRRPYLRLVRTGEQPGKRPLYIILYEIRSTIRGLSVDWHGNNRHFVMHEEKGRLNSRVEWNDLFKTNRDGSPKVRRNVSAISFISPNIRANKTTIERLIDLQSHITCYLGAAEGEFSVTQLNNGNFDRIRMLGKLIGELKERLMEAR